MRRGSQLPRGTGKAVKVAVFATGEKAKEAIAAGAYLVGTDLLVERILKGTIDFDKCLATPGAPLRPPPPLRPAVPPICVVTSLFDD